MDKLTLDEAKHLNDTCVTEEHRKLHAANVSACMEAMAEHFGEDPEHWAAVGCLHDYDYGKFPDGHLAHTAEPLRAAGVPEEDTGTRLCSPHKQTQRFVRCRPDRKEHP